MADSKNDGTAMEQNYKTACEIYAGYGVDVAGAERELAKIKLSVHAWQGDDVTGFEAAEAHALTGGCQVTGNYPGRARNSEELRRDLDLALKLIPGKHKVCLQGHEVDRMFPGVDRDAFSTAHFSGWLDWAKQRGIGLDIAPAFYSHPKLDHGYSLSHPDPEIRRFWINHGKAIRKIAETFGRELGMPSVCNFWAPDGSKDVPADRFGYRSRLMESLDACFEEKLSPEYELDAVESKLFGIGTECYTAGSHDFCLTYAAARGKMICLDTGHFHPTESVADKISALAAFQRGILLHVSRGVHWDSDHVVLLNDDLLTLAREIVYGSHGVPLFIGLDYFDASINRIAAWVIGARNMQKALLTALLTPFASELDSEREWDWSGRLAKMEEHKALPWGAVWNHFCAVSGTLPDAAFLNEIRRYEKTVLSVR